MRMYRMILLLLTSCSVLPQFASADDAIIDDQIIIDESSGGVPVSPAILTRRYGHLETEPEVAAEELEAGYGATSTFKFVHWNRYRRPFGWYGFYGPGYVGYFPRYFGYYPSYAFGYPSYAFGYPGFGYPTYAPYWAGYYGGLPYTTFYAPRAYYGGYGGCFYW